MSGIMKKCCGLCPFAREGTLYIHPERAQELAFSAQNPVNDFICHKTGVAHDDSGEILPTNKSLTCMGFATLKSFECGDPFEGFIPDPNGFESIWDMIDHHENHVQQ